MKVSTERLPESQVAIEIEVDDERLQKAMASAFKRLASKTRIPGFRPGKAPREVLERHLGEHAVLHEAIDRLMPQVYKEALEQEDISPIDQAGYELVTEEPLVAKFTVPVHPSVDLGDYASLRVEKDAVEVEAERVDESLEGLQHRYATLEPAERAVQWGDILRADVAGTVGEKVLVQEEAVEFQIVEGRTISIPGFAEAMVGHEKGPEFEFKLSVPDDAPDETLRGQEAQYKVRILEVKEEILPELDDEFAGQVGEGFSDMAALRSRVEDDLRETLEQENERRYHDQILAALVEQAEIEYPQVLVDRETERLLREQAGSGQPGRGDSKDDLEQYLQRVGKSEDELQSELRPMADERVRRSLVLSQVEEAEDIHVTDDEVEAEISRMTEGVGTQGDELRKLLSNDSAKESLQRSLITKKTLERLAEIASTDGVAEEAQPSASRDG